MSSVGIPAFPALFSVLNVPRMALTARYLQGYFDSPCKKFVQASDLLFRQILIPVPDSQDSPP